MSPSNLLFWIVIHGLAVAAVITWIYDTNFMAEISNVLPGKRPVMFLRKDFDDWLLTTHAPGWLQALITCGKCGTAHAAFWITLPVIFQSPLWVWPLLWAGSAGFSLFLKRQLLSK